MQAIRPALTWTAALLLAATLAAPAAAQHLKGLAFEPARITAATPVVAQVSGEFPSAAFQMAEDPKVTIQGQAITVELQALPPRGMAAAVMTPFTVAVPLGTLPVGRYATTVKLSFKGLPMPPQQLGGQFEVLKP